MACIYAGELSPKLGKKLKGQIQVIFGPMFSGKTTELMRRVKRYEIANYRCLVVKYAHDNRYEEENLSTHDKQTRHAVAALRLEEIRSKATDYDVIGLDEGQFYPDVVEFSEAMANLGKIVVVAALDGTYQRKGFGSILELVPLAESVVKLTAVCMSCYSDASYTQRIGNEQQLEIIGGADKYLAVCRSCYQAPPRRSPQKPVTPRSKNSVSGSTVRTPDKNLAAAAARQLQLS